METQWPKGCERVELRVCGTTPDNGHEVKASDISFILCHYVDARHVYKQLRSFVTSLAKAKQNCMLQ